MTTQKYLKLEIETQVSSISEIEKQICPFSILGEVTARQFCSEIYWPLDDYIVSVQAPVKGFFYNKS